MFNPLPKKGIACLVFSFIGLTSFNVALAKEKLKIFIMSGQSNMVGHASPSTIATILDDPGNEARQIEKLIYKENSGLSKKLFEEQLKRAQEMDQIKKDLAKIKDADEKKKLNDKLSKLKSDHTATKKKFEAAVKTSDQVYIASIADRNVKSGKLSSGYGANDKKFGPELGFGLSIAQKVKGPILLIKASWGGRTINYNFRSPSAGPYELAEGDKKMIKKKKINQADYLKKSGGDYRALNEHVKSVLSNLKKYHPGYDPKVGYEVSGFVWFQGFNDQFAHHAPFYKDNMIAFINDIRKEYKTPNMPFVIGVIGTQIEKEKVDQNKVAIGQRAAAAHPEFKGNVKAVESYKYASLDSYAVFKKGWKPHFNEWATVGNDRPYHYLGSGKFFIRLGNAFAGAMAGMMPKHTLATK